MAASSRCPRAPRCGSARHRGGLTKPHSEPSHLARVGNDRILPAFSQASGGAGGEAPSTSNVMVSSSTKIFCRLTTWKSNSWMCMVSVSSTVIQFPDLRGTDSRVLGDGACPHLHLPRGRLDVGVSVNGAQHGGAGPSQTPDISSRRAKRRVTVRWKRCDRWQRQELRRRGRIRRHSRDHRNCITWPVVAGWAGSKSSPGTPPPKGSSGPTLPRT